MEGEEGGGIRLSKRFDDYNKKSGGGGGGGGGGGDEVDYKNKSGTAWSHSYLNQKPWHPLSYPNQRRKWIAEQTHAQRHRRTEEVAREYAQEQEFFRQTALISKKEKEKIEMMKAVSFMYVRPPGYNAESAKAAEIADASQPPAAAASSSSNSMHPESVAGDHKKKPRPKDAFGRPLPTQEEFQVLTNAPRLETGVPARVKPFGIEVRNVKCLRCGKYGHQSGDRECPLKDVIMPNEESRLKRDDPLTAIVAQTDPSEPLKWELKQKPGISPPRGGFNPDDPNQQIVAEDIFDEYGGFLSGGNIPDLLTNFSPSDRKKKSKRSKHKKEPSPSREIWEENGLSSPSNKEEKRSNEEKKREKKKSLWWKTPTSHIEDRIALLFFFSVFWGFYPLYNAVFTFPQERRMLVKERASGMYHLSSYFLARTFGDLPLELALPTAFVFIIYWMGGLKADPITFILSLLVVLYSVLVSQSLGLAIGAILMDVKQATTLASVTTLVFLIAGGYYVQQIPPFIVWLKYLSYSYYCYKLLLGVQYNEDDHYECSKGGGLCRVGDFPAVKSMGLDHLWVDVAIMALMLVGYRIVAYLALHRVQLR